MPETLKQVRQLRPRVAANLDLNLLRAACNRAVPGGLLAHSPFRIGDVPAITMPREEARTPRCEIPAGDEDEGQAGSPCADFLRAPELERFSSPW